MEIISPVKRVAKQRIDPVVHRSLMVCCGVILFGTIGYTWIEDWSVWESLFFTLVTLTTVGYGDYGLSEEGERFTAVLMILGIASVSYAVSQFIQFATACVLLPEKKMISKAKKLQNHCIVCGLGRTGQRVMSIMREQGVPFVAVDPDRELVDQAREEGIIAICGDATCDRVLQDAGVEQANLLAAVTSLDSVNAMICLTSRAIAPDIRIAARVEGEASVQKLIRAGADSVINQASYGGDGIAKSLLHPEVANLLYGASDGSTKALQFSEILVCENSGWINKKIIDLAALNSSVVIVAIRGADGALVMRPDVERTLRRDDILVVAGSAADLDKLSPRSLAA